MTSTDHGTVDRIVGQPLGARTQAAEKTVKATDEVWLDRRALPLAEVADDAARCVEW
ncbi:MAG TPA: hypothetical protein VMV22_13660 [Acidimicrobiales bacterium]|nr:hypothetical protein [Acidimicrobiales bacterium]